MVYVVAIWMRGLVLRWQITDRKYRLALRAAATKSASRSFRAYTPYSYLSIKYYVITVLLVIVIIVITHAAGGRR
jgi:hypothetical protein